jgi:hypothetical protein
MTDRADYDAIVLLNDARERLYLDREMTGAAWGLALGVIHHAIMHLTAANPPAESGFERWRREHGRDPQ